MVAPALLQHVRNELRSNRRTALVLLVLARVRKQRQHSCNALRTCDLARVDHDAHLHERPVHLSRAGVHNVHIVLAHRLCDAHRRLPDAVDRHLRLRHGDTKSIGWSKGGADVRQRLLSWRTKTITHLRAIISASSGWLVPMSS